jgi:membrane protease YdiL (CAAX protease family)
VEQSVGERLWRHPGMQLLIAIGFVFGAYLVVAFVSIAIQPYRGGIWAVALGAATAIVFIAMYVLFCRAVERRPASELGLKRWAPELGAGLLIGLALFSCVVAVIWAFGGYRVIGYHDAAVLLPALGISLSSGFSEEIIMRGLFFRLVEKWLGSWAALALSAALFGALHLGNPNATLPAAVAIMLEAGIMLAAIYMITRRLWAAIGVHAAWNFAQGGIYGINVSGLQLDGLLRPDIRGSALLTGGGFGAEASLPAIIVATAFGLTLLVIAYRRGQFTPPLWVRNRHGAGVHVYTSFSL